MRHSCHPGSVVHRKNWYWWLIGAVIFFAVAPPLTGVIVGIAAAAGYVVSLAIHPFMVCRACGGTGRHTGKILAYSHRQCMTCGGQQRHRRLGLVVFSRLKPAWAESRARNARDTRRNRPL